MKKKIFILILCSLAVAALPAILFQVVFGKITTGDSILAIAVSVALLNFSRRKGKKVFAVEMLATFCCSLTMCLVLWLWPH